MLYYIILCQYTVCKICCVIHEENSIRCNNISKFYYSIFIWNSPYSGPHTAPSSETQNCTGSFWFFIRGRFLDVWLVDVVRHTVPDNVHRPHVQQPWVKNKWSLHRNIFTFFICNKFILHL